MAAARLLNHRFPSSCTVFFPKKAPLLHKDRENDEQLVTSFFLHMPFKTCSPQLKDYFFSPYARTNGGKSIVSPSFNLHKFVKHVRHERDTSVRYKHPRCNTHTTRKVHKESLETGLVVIRCRGCDDLVAVVDHRHCFANGASQETIESFLDDFLHADVPPEGSKASVCFTFESFDAWTKAESVKLNKDLPPGFFESLQSILEEYTQFPQGWRRPIQAQSGTSGGSESEAQLGENGGTSPKEQKKKKKFNEMADPSAGDNSNNDVSSSPTFDPELVLVPNSKRDATLEFTHRLCNTESERRVNTEAFHTGVVVVRCGGCDDLVALADHANWFGEDGEHEKVEKLLGFLGVDVPSGSNHSFCATFESKDPYKTNGAKYSGLF